MALSCVAAARVSLAATGTVSGFGPSSYDLAIEAAAGLIRAAAPA